MRRLGLSANSVLGADVTQQAWVTRHLDKKELADGSVVLEARKVPDDEQGKIVLVALCNSREPAQLKITGTRAPHFRTVIATDRAARSGEQIALEGAHPSVIGCAWEVAPQSKGKFVLLKFAWTDAFGKEWALIASGGQI